MRRNLSPRVLLTAAGAIALVIALTAGARAQTKLEARYTASLAGIPLGTGTWVIDITSDQYTAVANGRTTGLVRLISNGSGSTGSRGSLQGANIASIGYISNTVSDKKADEVHMTLQNGVVTGGGGNSAARACTRPRAGDRGASQGRDRPDERRAHAGRR